MEGGFLVENCSLKERVRLLKTEISVIESQIKSLEDRKRKTTREIQEIDESVVLLQKVSVFFRNLIDREVLETVKLFDEMQTEGLRAIFYDQDLSVESKVDIQRGKVSVEFDVVHKKENGHIIKGSSLNQFGGAVLAVQSFILRVLLARKNGLKNFFVFDETFPSFDGNYAGKFAEFINYLSEKMSLDVLLVTHDPKMFQHAKKKYRIRKDSSGKVFFQHED